jgi:hypothetical protein
MLERRYCELVTRDTFVLPFDIKNLANKRVNELWQKHPKDPTSVRIWVMENPKSMFYYFEHVLMDLDCTSQYHTPFSIGIKNTLAVRNDVKIWIP